MTGCQAIPGAAMHAWSAKRLCAAEASTTVIFKGIPVPVCYTHSAMYRRQGNVFAAEKMAQTKWGWNRAEMLELVS